MPFSINWAAHNQFQFYGLEVLTPWKFLSITVHYTLLDKEWYILQVMALVSFQPKRKRLDQFHHTQILL